MKTNLKRWNEITKIHAKSKEYDMEGFLAGKNTLYELERKALGEVKGKSLLHLQCQFGMDTLSWAQLGAEVTGVDFSDFSINLAKDLSEQLNLSAEFICSNIFDLPSHLEKKFDIVFTSYGVLCWLPDIDKWAEIVSHYLKPGGIFFIAEFHPFSMIFDDEHKSELKYRYSYFDKGPLHFQSEYTYTDSEDLIDNVDTFEWQHTLSSIINALIKQGLTILEFEEFPFTTFQHFSFVEKHEDRYWRFKNNKYDIPMMFSIKATKK